MMEKAIVNSSTSSFSTPRSTPYSASECLSGTTGHYFLLGHKESILFLGPVYQLRRLVALKIHLLLNTEARRALNTSAFSSFHPIKGWRFSLGLLFFVNAFIETIVIIFPSLARLSFSWVFAFLNLFSTWSNDILVFFPSCLLPKVTNSLFVPGFQWNLPFQPGWTFSLLTCFSSRRDGSVDSFIKCCCSLDKLSWR